MWGFIKFLLYVIFVDLIGVIIIEIDSTNDTHFVKSQVGLVIATCLWYVSNKFLLKPTIREQDVEWGFCFDVHLNAFIPILVILHFVQLFIYHAIIGKIIIFRSRTPEPKC